MNNTHIVSSILLAIAIFSLMLYFIFLAIFNSFKKDKERHSILNTYPYEFYFGFNSYQRGLIYTFLIIHALLSCSGLSLYLASLTNGELYFPYLVASGFILATLAGVISNMISFNYYKTHLILAIISFIFNSLSMISMAFITIIPGGAYFIKEPSITNLILFGIFGFIEFFSLFNPKLFDWGKMYKAEDNGKTIYLKPKVNFFALYEWINLLLILLSDLLLFTMIF